MLKDILSIYFLSGCGADLALSGHCHAGQIRIPMSGSIVVPSAYGRRFDHGHFIVRGTHLFVASGIGAAYPPVRLYCQLDVFVVDMIEEKGCYRQPANARYGFAVQDLRRYVLR